MDMNNDPKKKGLRWLIFTWFGPQEVQNLVDYIDKIAEDSDNDEIIMLPMVKLQINMKGVNSETISYRFDTVEERDAFYEGMQTASNMMGGELKILSDEDFSLMGNDKTSQIH